MSLIKCSECGKEVSDKAEACPQCGNPIAVKEVRAVGTKKPVTFDSIEEGIDKFAEKLGPVTKFANSLPRVLVEVLLPALTVLMIVALCIPAKKFTVSTIFGSISNSTTVSLINTGAGKVVLIMLILELVMYALAKFNIIPKVFNKFRSGFAIFVFIFMIVASVKIGSATDAVTSLFSSVKPSVMPGIILGWIFTVLLLVEACMNILVKTKTFNFSIKVEKNK